MSTIDERITTVEDTNKDIKAQTAKMAELVIAHEADLVELKRQTSQMEQQTSQMARQTRQIQRMLMIVARKANWLDDEDVKRIDSDG